MAYFRCTTGGSGKGNTLVVTCADDLAGATITCTNGTKTYTKACPSTSPYEVTFYGLEAGTWTVSATVSGNTYTTTVVITDYEAALGGFSWKTWVNLSENYASSDFTDLDDLLSDETAIRELMTIHACVDYLAGIAAESPDVETIIGNDIAAKWINLRDYALDTLYANEIIADYMDTADKYFYGEWVITDNTTTPPTWGAKGNVPIMTANTAPYGEAYCDTNYNSPAYQAFNGNDSDGWYSNYDTAYVQYKHVNPILAKKVHIKFNQESNRRGSNTMTIKASNDGSTWDTLATYNNTHYGVAGTFDEDIELNNNTYYLYYRLDCAKTYAADTGYGGPTVLSLQFYGRELSVSVPIMTGDNTPYGVASASSLMRTDLYQAWKAFDGASTEQDRWIPSDSDTNSRLIYKFTSPTCVRKAKFYNFDKAITCKIQGSNTGNSNDWHDLTNVSSTIASATWYGTDIDNNDEYLYYAVCMPNQQSTSQNRISIREVQFYGLDYTEREFEEGATKKWLYDHGLELVDFGEPLKASTGTAIAEKQIDQFFGQVTGQTSYFIMSTTAIDLTPYNLMRAKSGNKAGNGGEASFSPGYFGVFSTRAISTTVLASGSPGAVPLLSPNMPGLDISSINQQAYAGMYDSTSNGRGRYWSMKELWLE